MFEFFRRYQKIFFIVITAVIVFSFSFFGAFSAFSGGQGNDPVAFVAVDGTNVYRSELNDVVHLIGTDNQEAFYRAGNAFNDGVIAQDILESGIASRIVAPYLPDLKGDLQFRLEKEKHFVPYMNKQANFISADQVWAYFAPDIKKGLTGLKIQTDGATPQAFQNRVDLFLAERRFPSIYLKQMLKYQEKEHEWLTPDEELNYKDLSLFGYHSVQDWFGKNFLDLTAKYIINTARIAEERGFDISRDEVLRSLWANVQASYKDITRNPYAQVGTLEDYYTDELRRLGMDQARLIKAWRDVMLFRKLFAENKDSILVSPQPYEGFYARQNEYIEVEVYKLPKEMAFQNLRDLEKFEIYVNAVRDPKEKSKNSLYPPKKILPATEVKKAYPELVQKRYKVRYTEVDKNLLATKVGLRKTWEWEVEDGNWKRLQKQFPVLGSKKAPTKEERREALDKLDAKTRLQIDDYARSLIVDESSDWIQEALKKNELKEEVLYLREVGGKNPFGGIKNRIEFMRLLDSAPLDSQGPLLSSYSQDGIHFYRIEVIERADAPEIMTLREANLDGTLDGLLNKALEATYQRVRSQKPAQYVQENGEWKPLSQVQDLVAYQHFEELFKQLDKERQSEQKAGSKACNWDDKEKARLACRLLGYMRDAREQIKQNEASMDYLQDLKSSDMLSEQFKLLRTKERIIREQDNVAVNKDEAFALAPNAFSDVSFVTNQGLVFCKVLEKGAMSAQESTGIREKIFEARDLLGSEVDRQLASKLLELMQQKKALRLVDDKS
jgi:GcvH upstream region-like protein